MRLLCGCRGCENCVVDGVRASNRDKSGVIVREAGPCCGLMVAIEFAEADGAAGLGVDQENAGA